MRGGGDGDFGPARQSARQSCRESGSRRAQRGLLGVMLVVVVAALFASSALVVYTAWIHDLKNGFFALMFAVLSAQVAINWFLWRDEAEE